jgi:hypothetical protein
VSPLERHYRRLLRAYPPAHRSVYADEMLGVLMDSATPGQRRPSARDTVQLLAHGVRARMLRPSRVRGGPGPQWSVAATVLAFVAALLMAAKEGYLLARLLGIAVSFPEAHVGLLPPDRMVAGCAWLATVLALTLRRGRLAAALATLAAGGELHNAVAGPDDVHAGTVIKLCAATLAVVATVVGRRTPLPRRRPLAALTLATLVLVGGEAAQYARGSHVGEPAALGWQVGTGAAVVVVVLAFGWVVVDLPVPVAGRLLVLAAPVVAQILTYLWFEQTNPQWQGPSPAALYALLIAAAVLAPLTALPALRWIERLHRLVVQGRAAENRAAQEAARHHPG